MTPPDPEAGSDEGTGGKRDPEQAQEEAAQLRRRAEARMEKEPAVLPPDLEGLSWDEVRRALHELRVHQIELEMQNEELRQSRTQLEASRARYFDLFDLAPVGYFSLSVDARILEVNLTGGALLGVPPAGLLDRPLTDFILPDDQDSYYHHRRAVAGTGSPATCELRMLRGDGTSFHARLESAPCLPMDNRVTVRTVVSDITERTLAAEERRLLEHRLQQVQKAESLGRMAGAMSHHFNNLLGVITGNLEMALEEAPEGKDPTEAGQLRDALEAARTATRLTQLLLAYLGHTRSEPVLMELSEIGRRATALLRIAMPSGTDFSASLPSPGPLVQVSPGDMLPLLTNLVTNAWEAVEPGTASIHLTVSTARPDEIPREHRFPAGWMPTASTYACLQVQDEGPGIEPDAMSEIFDPFYSTRTFGRGLGLSVALGTAKAHGGSIAVEARPGRGTTFAVYLPVAVASAEDPGVRERVDRSAGGIRRAGLHAGTGIPAEGPTVLVVDDNAMLRKLAVRILGRMGFRVVEASDGVEAVSVFQEHRELIRVVLCDVTMPRMGGWATLAALRRIDPGLPVILTSGYDDAIDAGGSHEEPPDAFVGKPWRLDELRAALTRAVGSHPAGEDPGDQG